jgi:hypothetical protein
MSMSSPGFRYDDAYSFAEANGLAVEAGAIRKMRVHPDVKHPAPVRKGYLVALFESHGLFEEFAKEHWPGLKRPSGQNRLEKYRQHKALNENLIAGGGGGDPAPGTDDDEDIAGFSLESQLRDFLADNIEKLRVGSERLRLYTGGSSGSGIEVTTGVGRIDILAVDVTGNYYVFELKLGRGADHVLGQLARYMGWVKTHLARTTQVYGIVVAARVDERLRYAASVIPHVRLLEYEIDFRLKDAVLPQPPDEVTEVVV